MKTLALTTGTISKELQNRLTKTPEGMIPIIAANPKLTQSDRQWLAMEADRTGVDFDDNGTAIEENPHGFDPELAGLI